ncbi:winged helix-turn-helix domain-containing protein [Bradyrhizobium sp. DOA9]|uniref:winged helix-turn-helix domain-containing protein n=1 Tax=Bradyrhizobium sp. DOA9 TaxID=1126627 RepID=UPI00072369A6|nr:winged helix-turn-helix domain-containing protein [Bradyrhizobium sp. DOA9]GAJ35189.1 hypothetical protein BDOA9_0143890 [Bradyrhizobium sp. DOA9]
MAVPDFQSLLLPALKVAQDGLEHNLTETLDSLAEQFGLSEEDRAYYGDSALNRISPSSFGPRFAHNAN